MSLLPEINQASAEINKLVAQANIHQTIAPVNPAAFTDPADTMLLASRDPVIREVSVGMTGDGDGYSDYSVFGTPPLSLPNSLGKPLKAWSVDLLPYQEGTGDPAPDNVRPIHGTDKLNLFVEESYDQSTTPKAVLTLPQTVYTGTIGSEGGERRSGMLVIDGVNVQGNIVSTIYISDTVTRAYCQIRNVNIPQTSYPQRVTKCNCAVYSTSVVNNTQTYYLANSGPHLEINVRLLNSLTGITTSDTVAEAKTKWNAYVAQHPIQVYYETATPTTFALTSPTIPTPTGTATTWATAEDGTVDGMEVTYVGKA